MEGAGLWENRESVNQRGRRKGRGRGGGVGR